MRQPYLFRIPKKPWNTGLGPTGPAEAEAHIWEIRQQLRANGRRRDLAMFSGAIDAKLRAPRAAQVSDVVPSGLLRTRSTVIQQKTGRPVPFEIPNPTPDALAARRGPQRRSRLPLRRSDCRARRPRSAGLPSCAAAPRRTAPAAASRQNLRLTPEHCGREKMHEVRNSRPCRRLGHGLPSEMSVMSQVLLVEDELLVAELVEDTLRDQGMAVATAHSGWEACARLEAEPRSFAVVVTDINLGCRLTGFDVARKAREMNPDVKVVYVTGLPSNIYAAEEEALMFPKPFNVIELGNQVGLLLRGA